MEIKTIQSCPQLHTQCVYCKKFSKHKARVFWAAMVLLFVMAAFVFVDLVTHRCY